MNLSARIECRGTRPNWVQRHVAAPTELCVDLTLFYTL